MRSKEIKNINWVYGNDTEDVLGNMFDRKIGAHVETPGSMETPSEKDRLWDDLMGSGNDGRKRSAYINIPFCQTKCLYCGFFKNWSDPKKETDYVGLLAKEMHRDKDSNFLRSHPFNAIYIGGGTPSTLSAENIRLLMDGINDNLHLANDCEITFESRLYQMDDDKIETCLDGGVNRFSFGVQSFNTKVRQSIGRVLDREKVIDRLGYVQDLGMATVVIDLMYGLSYQSQEVWDEDLQTYIDLELDGCDLYQLIVFKNSDLEKKVEDSSIGRTATVPEQSRMFEYGINKMDTNRMRRLSNCHWSNGYRERSMYNSMTLSDSIVVPFGSGSGGNIADHRFFLDPRLEEYSKMVEEGRKPLMGMVRNSPYQSLYRNISGSLNEGSLDLKHLGKRYGIATVTGFMDLLKAWEKKGLLILNKHSVDLTTAGQFWSVTLSQALVDWHQHHLPDETNTSKSKVTGHPPGIPKDNNPPSPGGKVMKGPGGLSTSDKRPPIDHSSGASKEHPHATPGGHPAGIPKGHPPWIDINGKEDRSSEKKKGKGNDQKKAESEKAKGEEGR